jgi:hypothetical protein
MMVWLLLLVPMMLMLLLLLPLECLLATKVERAAGRWGGQGVRRAHSKMQRWLCCHVYC